MKPKSKKQTESGDSKKYFKTPEAASNHAVERLLGATYVERADAMKREAVPVIVERIKKAWGNFHAGAQGIKTGAILGANSSLEIGLELQGWCGHENMSFMFWKTNCEKLLPFDFEAAKFFMSVARKMKKKATTIAETWEFAQLVLTVDGALPLAESTGSRHAALIPPLQKLCCQFVMLRKPLQKIMNLAPMETWEQDDVRLFLSETEWLEIERQKAERLLKKK